MKKERQKWDEAIETVLRDCGFNAKKLRRSLRFEMFLTAMSGIGMPAAELRQIRHDVGPLYGYAGAWYGRRAPAARLAAAA